LSFQLAQADPRFRLDITVGTGTTQLRVESIGLVTEGTHGKVTVEQDVVKLSGVSGKAAGGEILGDATLDFRGPVTKMDFHLTARNLDVSRLPRSWELPSQITGNLSGKADLVVTVKGGRVHTSGSGQGTIGEARLAGFPAEPIQLRLHS